MTVEDLIKKLQELPPHMLVTHNDGENGRMDVSKVAVERDYQHTELEVLELS
jgi:hypothetical protein